MTKEENGSEELLQELARLYAAGEVTWSQIKAELDELGFGELLLELGRQGLALPMVTAAKTPEQRAVWEAVLRRAALEPDADARPTTSAVELVAGPCDRAAATAPGKWLIARREADADSLWRLVVGAVASGRLYAAKCSDMKRADLYASWYLIAVYAPGELAAEARAVLRELGVSEPLGYVGTDGGVRFEEGY